MLHQKHKRATELKQERKDMATTEKALRESIVAHGARIVASEVSSANFSGGGA